jgi:hypothetical protein
LYNLEAESIVKQPQENALCSMKLIVTFSPKIVWGLWRWWGYFVGHCSLSEVCLIYSTFRQFTVVFVWLVVTVRTGFYSCLLLFSWDGWYGTKGCWILR